MDSMSTSTFRGSAPDQPIPMNAPTHGGKISMPNNIVSDMPGTLYKTNRASPDSYRHLQPSHPQNRDEKPMSWGYMNNCLRGIGLPSNLNRNSATLNPTRTSYGRPANWRKLRGYPSLPLMTVHEHDSEVDFQQRMDEERAPTVREPTVARSLTVGTKSVNPISVTFVAQGDAGSYAPLSPQIVGPVVVPEKASKSYVDVADTTKTSGSPQSAMPYDPRRNKSEVSLGRFAPQRSDHEQGRPAHLLKKALRVPDSKPDVKRRDGVNPLEPENALRKKSSSYFGSTAAAVDIVIIPSSGSSDVYFVQCKYGGFALCRGITAYRDSKRAEKDSPSPYETLSPLKSPAKDMGIRVPSMKRQYLALGETGDPKHLIEKKNMEQFERWMLLS